LTSDLSFIDAPSFSSPSRKLRSADHRDGGTEASSPVRQADAAAGNRASRPNPEPCLQVPTTERARRQFRVRLLVQAMQGRCL
jgi:hypothetical protein